MFARAWSWNTSRVPAWCTPSWFPFPSFFSQVCLHLYPTSGIMLNLLNHTWIRKKASDNPNKGANQYIDVKSVRVVRSRANVLNPSICKQEAGGSRVQGHPINSSSCLKCFTITYQRDNGQIVLMPRKPLHSLSFVSFSFPVPTGKKKGKESLSKKYWRWQSLILGNNFMARLCHICLRLQNESQGGCLGT